MYGDLQIDWPYELWYGLGEVEELDPEEGEYDRARVTRGTKSYPRNFGGSERNDRRTKKKNRYTREHGWYTGKNYQSSTVSDRVVAVYRLKLNK